MPLGAASCERAERPALSAGADPAARPGHPRAGAGGRGGASRGGDGSGDATGAAQPAPPGLPQGADEAVDRAFRVQGHDVPYVEEAGHFIRHAASCSKVDVPPLPCALAALSGEPPRQRRNGAHGCSADSGGEGHGLSDRVSWLSPAPAPGERARSKAAAADTPRRAQPGHPRAAGAASSAGFLFLSEVFSPTPLLLLPPPPLPHPCPLPALRPTAAVPATRRVLVVAKPLGPLGGIFGPGGDAHWAEGRRGARGKGVGAQSASGGRGRSWSWAGRLCRGQATREAARCGVPRALEGRLGARAGERARYSHSGSGPGVRQSPQGKAKDGGAKTYSPSF